MANDGGFPQGDSDTAACTALALAVEASGTGVWDRDIATGRIHYSRAWKAMLGYAEHEISDRIEDSVPRVHPEDRATVRATIQAHLDQKTSLYEVEHRLRCKDGSYIWVLSRGKVTSRDASGRALRMAGVTTDISDTVALSQKLLESAQLLTRLTDEVPGLVYQYCWSPSGQATYLYASAGVKDIFNLSPADVAADAGAVDAMIHPDDIAQWRETLQWSAATLARWQLEFRVRLPVAGEQWRKGEATPHRMDDGSTVWHGFIADISEQKRIERQLQEAADTDFLTGLHNRRYVMARMEQELARMGRDSGIASAVLMFDLDHFKLVNDRHGHAAGDDVLKHFAQLLRQELRKVDAAGRIGGEEFAVILSGADMQDAYAFAERLRARLAQGASTVMVTVSIGIAAMHGSDPGTAAALSRADAALYRAKQLGRDRIEVAA